MCLKELSVGEGKGAQTGKSEILPVLIVYTQFETAFLGAVIGGSDPCRHGVVPAFKIDQWYTYTGFLQIWTEDQVIIVSRRYRSKES